MKTSTIVTAVIVDCKLKSMEYNLEETPFYYVGSPKSIEALDVVMDFQRDNYNIGTALTYLMRAGKKPGNPLKQDIIKAIVHLQRELKFIQENEGNNLISNGVRQGQSILQGHWYSTTTNPTGEEPGADRED